MTLDELGPRICILGPSNSGKSTLAGAIVRTRGLPVFHLDLLRHLPGTDWEQRPDAEFTALHDQAIAGERWVMEGNYSHLLPARQGRATGVILLDSGTAVSLFRYVRRSWFERDRVGALDGGRDSVKWEMIRHIVRTTPKNRRRYRAWFDALDLPKVQLGDATTLAAFYRAEGLSHRY